MEKVYKKKKKTGHRVFVALMPDKKSRDAIRRINRKIKKYSYKLRYVNLEQLHLTLKFLGNNVSDQSILDLSDGLYDIARRQEAFNLTISGVNFGLGKSTKPNTIFAQIESNKSTLSLSSEIADLVKSIQLQDVIRRKDRKKFVEHITIARVKRDISKSFVRQVQETLSDAQFEPVSFKVSRISLVESVLTKTGPIYSTYREYRLKGQY